MMSKWCEPQGAVEGVKTRSFILTMLFIEICWKLTREMVDLSENSRTIKNVGSRNDHSEDSSSS